MKWYLTVLKKYADFKGRASRKEYWMFVLFNIVFAIAAFLLDRILGLTSLFQGGELGILTILYPLAVFIPGLAVTVRRLHDVGKSGWMLLIALIPLIGPIWLWVLYLTDSVPGANRYGPNPKEASTQHRSNFREVAVN